MGVAIMSVERDEQRRFHEHLPGLIPFFCAFCAFSRQRGFPHLSRQMAPVPSNRLRIVVFQAGLKAGFSRHWPPPARFATEPRCFSRIAWPLGRWRPPAVLAMGQNRQKTGKTGLLTPSTNSGRLEPEWVRAKSNSPSPAQRSVQAGAQKPNSYHLTHGYYTSCEHADDSLGGLHIAPEGYDNPADFGCVPRVYQETADRMGGRMRFDLEDYSHRLDGTANDDHDLRNYVKLGDQTHFRSFRYKLMCDGVDNCIS